MKKEYIAYGALALIIILILFMRGSGDSPFSLISSPTSSPSTSSPSPTSSFPSAIQKPSAKAKASFPQGTIITYTESGYSPATLTVKAGTRVTFKNATLWPMWPASAAHPTHRVYPTSGGCIGSTFDACKEVQPNDSWSFTFDYKGTWKYHDHARPHFTGTIVVQ